MPHSLKIVLLLLQLVAVWRARPMQCDRLRPDSSPNAMDIIKSRGFIGELYKIKSPDGYTLSVYHLINPLADPRTLNEHPVIIFHGLMGDASQMIGNSLQTRPRRPLVGSFSIQPDDTCLAFMFSNNNFDVWLMDSRGSNLNNHNARVDINIAAARKFYNFSLDEQALLDVPAQLSFVLKKTQAEKVISVGYSESTLFTFALLSAVPEWADRYAAFIAMAPIAYLRHLKGAGLGLLSTFYSMPDEIIGSASPQPFVDSAGLAIRSFCSSQSAAYRGICGAFAQTLGGIGVSNNEPGFYANIFKGTSIKAMKHFTQLYFQDRFGMYDFGARGNQVQYGQLRPPDYDLSKIKLNRIILVRGLQDFLSNPEDQSRLLRELGTRPYLDIVLPYFNHFDFIMGRSIINDVNLPVLANVFAIITNNGRTNPVRNPNKPVPGPNFIQEPFEVILPDSPHAGPNKVLHGHARFWSNILSGLAPENSSLISNPNLPRDLSGVARKSDGFTDMFNNLLSG